MPDDSPQKVASSVLGEVVGMIGMDELTFVLVDQSPGTNDARSYSLDRTYFPASCPHMSVGIVPWVRWFYVGSGRLELQHETIRSYI